MLNYPVCIWFTPFAEFIDFQLLKTSRHHIICISASHTVGIKQQHKAICVFHAITWLINEFGKFFH